MHEADELYKKGYQFIIPMSDSTSLGQIARDTFDTFRKLYPDR